MKIREALDKFGKEEARIALAYIMNISFGQLMVRKDEDLDSKIFSRLEEVMDLYDKGLPIQYAIGFWDFYGRTFKVSPDVLIPRPETELLCEKILSDGISGKKVLDIGCGSGAIAVTLSLEEENAIVYASDISEEALRIAMENSERLSATVSFFHSDLFDDINGKYDVIVSNPPYINQRDYEKLDNLLYHEPKLALLAGEKGYEIYERIIASSKNYLEDGGRIYFEIGYDQGNIVKRLLENEGFSNVQLIKDYGGNDRILVAYL